MGEISRWLQSWMEDSRADAGLVKVEADAQRLMGPVQQGHVPAHQPPSGPPGMPSRKRAQQRRRRGRDEQWSAQHNVLGGVRNL
jgi:hypothetical protein